jgi:hypothetical protein
MAGRRPLAMLLAFTVAGSAASSVALAAPNYPGNARSVALTAAQAKYKALTGSAAAAKPPADKRHGFRSGWQTSYLKGTAAAPVEAYSLIYIYSTASDANRAYASSCKACTGKIRVQGIKMKFQLTKEKGTPGVINIAACRNVYVAIVVSGKLKTAALAQAAGALAGGIYAKAMAGGMTPCGS